MSDRSQPPLTVDGIPRAFFGRRSGKKLHDRQRQLVETLLPDLAISLDEPPLDPGSLFSQPTAQLIVEIGYGGGEHLARQARQSPQTSFIGCEVFANGIAKILEKIETDKITNIRLYTDDALNLLQALPAASLDGVYLLYPDPWPKNRHHKRRFVSPTTLCELARTIKPKGYFRFATDIEDYANWTLAHILRTTEFAWPLQKPGAWHQPFEGWQPTRYEQKARREGRTKSYYFSFERRSGPSLD